MCQHSQDVGVDCEGMKCFNVEESLENLRVHTHKITDEVMPPNNA